MEFYFNNQMFNPAYVNPTYYYQVQAQIEMLRREAEQNREIVSAVHAVQDLCKAIRNMDAQHQQQAFYLCLSKMAEEFGW